MSDIESQTDDEPDVYIDLYYDPRVQWMRDRVLAFIGMDDKDLFYNMLEVGDAKQKFTHLLTSPMKTNDMALERRVMYVTKVIVDKLIHEDKEFTEWSKLLKNLHISVLLT